MSYSIDFRRKVIFTMEEEGLSIRETAKQFRIGSASVSRWIIAKHLNFDYKIYVFLQYKFTDIESLLVIILKSPSYKIKLSIISVILITTVWQGC
ncbi:IS630 transposase-related protein [Arsenophonus endosymbiont of Bemisia tabaci]|uniref:IS630 transposase-related protein n=1 Tax=Arsenophonus endosymbiont of Bemisia tabaci TaxID=536059 RepID=UPI0015F422AD|nr:IS630 transposase-related protein [Arsenophonus endosymbiont of Bemisia tabaci]